MRERQKRFVDEYIATGNGAEAARRAGYSKKNSRQIASENLTKLDTQINDRLGKLSNERVATTQEVLERLSSIIRGEDTEIIVTAAGKKVKVPAKIGDKINAARHLLKVAGAYHDKVDIKVDGAQLLIQTLLKIDRE